MKDCIEFEQIKLIGVDERRQEKRSEIDKRSLFPFPLKTTSNEEVEPTEIPVNQSSIKSSDSSQSNLEQRRLSFGIKLKKGANLPPVPSSSKSSAVCSTSTSCESSQQEQVCELDLNYQLKAKASGEGKFYDFTEMSMRNYLQLKCIINNLPCRLCSKRK